MAECLDLCDVHCCGINAAERKVIDAAVEWAKFHWPVFEPQRPKERALWAAVRELENLDGGE